MEKSTLLKNLYFRLFEVEILIREYKEQEAQTKPKEYAQIINNNLIVIIKLLQSEEKFLYQLIKQIVN